MPDRLQKFLIWLLAIGLTVGTGVALRYAGGYRRIAGFSEPVILPPNVTLRLEKVTAVGRRNNQRAWTLRADRVDSSKDRTQVRFDGGIELVLLNEGKPRATLKAATASYMAYNQTLNVTGRTVAILKDPKSGADSLKVETDTVLWNAGSRQINAPGKVALTLKDGRVTGNQLVVDLKTRNYAMRDFEAEFAIGEGDAPPDPLGGLLGPGGR